MALLPYLLDRFRTDAETLRQRAAALRMAPTQPGPDAATSQRMAEACDTVIAMIEAIPAADDSVVVASSLTALIPLLERHATMVASAPPVRAVYAGAATRIREVVDAELRHVRGGGMSLDDDLDDDDLDEDRDEDDAS